jgi:hypothetical protein
MKASIVRYLARHDPSGQVRDSVGKLIPKAVVFFRGSIIGRLNRMTLFHEGVKVDHFFITVESTEYGLGGDRRGEGGDDGVACSNHRGRWCKSSGVEYG